MSVSAFILEPQNEFEKSFNIPVATEVFFNECWMPAVEELGLKWVEIFLTGIDVTKEDLPSVLSELSQIKEWAKNHLKQDNMEHMIKRIEILEDKLPQAYQRENAVVFIG